MAKINKSIIFFDGVCNLCNSSVQFILKRDTNKKFMFASLQSDVAKKLLLHKNVKNNFDSIILLDKGKIYNKSIAILKIGKTLGFPYSLGSIFFIIPKFIRDFIYDWIAKNRYKWFGKKDSCMIPTKEYLERFLES